MHRESLWQISHGKGQPTGHRVGAARQCAVPLPVPTNEAASGLAPDGRPGLTSLLVLGQPRGLRAGVQPRPVGWVTQPESSTAPGVAITPIRHTSNWKGVVKAMEDLKDGDQVFVIQRESEMYRKTGRVVENGARVAVRFDGCPRLWHFERKWLLKLIY